MKRDLANLLGQLLTGRNKYICESIDDFKKNKGSIKHWGDYAFVSFEGHYFLSYDFVVDSAMILCDWEKINVFMNCQCENGVLEHFGGSGMEVDVAPFLHISNYRKNNHVSKESIFGPNLFSRNQKIFYP